MSAENLLTLQPRQHRKLCTLFGAIFASRGRTRFMTDVSGDRPSFRLSFGMNLKSGSLSLTSCVSLLIPSLFTIPLDLFSSFG